MELITTSNVEKAKQEIKKAVKPIMVRARSNEFNRKMLEYGKFDVLLSPEDREERVKDRPKQLDSGFNHVMAKIATKNNVAIGIDIVELKSLNKIDKAQRIARVRQNISICRKFKTKIALCGVRNSLEARELLLSLGASTQQAKSSVIIVR